MKMITEPGFYGGRFRRAGESMADDEPAVPDEATPALDKMSKAELLAEAERRGVAVNDGDTKAEILAALGV